MAYVAMANTEVCDLHVVLSGAKQLVKLQRGQVLPLDLLDVNDVKKSLAFGALGRLIRSGWIKEVDDADAANLSKKMAEVTPLSEREAPATIKPLQPAAKTNHAFVQDMSAEELHDLRQSKGMVQSVDLTGDGAGKAVAVKDVEFEMGVGTNAGGGIGMVVAERRPELGETRDSVVDETTGRQTLVGSSETYETKSDLGAVSDFSAFEGLNHFDQLLFIKQCGDKNLLTEIADKNAKKQIQNNARKRMSEL